MKFIVYVPPFKDYNRCHIEAWDSILKCEGKDLHMPVVTEENSKKCMILGKGTGLPILVVEQDEIEEYIGFHYSDLVRYFNDNGLMLC